MSTITNATETVNRRRHERRPYICTRRMAPYGATPLSRHDFSEIRCRDLSTGGIGFFTAEKPSAEQLLIELGEARGSICVVVARVVYCRGCDGHLPHRFNVGCEFVKRLS